MPYNEDGEWVVPTTSGPTTSKVGDPRGGGRLHGGVDKDGYIGEPVPWDLDEEGEVVAAESRGGYGNLVVVRTPSGRERRYAHLNKYHVKVGDKIQKGQVFAEIGNTGAVRKGKGGDGSHLHYEEEDYSDRAKAFAAKYGVALEDAPQSGAGPAPVANDDAAAQAFASKYGLSLEADAAPAPATQQQPVPMPTHKGTEGEVSADGVYKFQNHTWVYNNGLLPSQQQGAIVDPQVKVIDPNNPQQGAPRQQVNMETGLQEAGVGGGPAGTNSGAPPDFKGDKEAEKAWWAAYRPAPGARLPDATDSYQPPTIMGGNAEQNQYMAGQLVLTKDHEQPLGSASIYFNSHPDAIKQVLDPARQAEARAGVAALTGPEWTPEAKADQIAKIEEAEKWAAEQGGFKEREAGGIFSRIADPKLRASMEAKLASGGEFTPEETKAATVAAAQMQGLTGAGGDITGGAVLNPDGSYNVESEFRALRDLDNTPLKVQDSKGNWVDANEQNLKYEKWRAQRQFGIQFSGEGANADLTLDQANARLRDFVFNTKGDISLAQEMNVEAMRRGAYGGAELGPDGKPILVDGKGYRDKKAAPGGVRVYNKDTGKPFESEEEWQAYRDKNAQASPDKANSQRTISVFADEDLIRLREAWGGESYEVELQKQLDDPIEWGKNPEVQARRAKWLATSQALRQVSGPDSPTGMNAMDSVWQYYNGLTPTQQKRYDTGEEPGVAPEGQDDKSYAQIGAEVGINWLHRKWKEANQAGYFWGAEDELPKPTNRMEHMIQDAWRIQMATPLSNKVAHTLGTGYEDSQYKNIKFHKDKNGRIVVDSNPYDGAFKPVTAVNDVFRRLYGFGAQAQGGGSNIGQEAYQQVSTFTSGLLDNLVQDYDPRYDRAFNALSPDQQQAFMQWRGGRHQIASTLGATGNILLNVLATRGAGSTIETLAAAAKLGKLRAGLQTSAALLLKGEGVGMSLVEAGVFSAMQQARQMGAPTLDEWAAGKGWNPYATYGENISTYMKETGNRLPDNILQFQGGRYFEALAERIAKQYGLTGLKAMALGRAGESFGEMAPEAVKQLAMQKLDVEALTVNGVAGLLMGTKAGGGKVFFKSSQTGTNYLVDPNTGVWTVASESGLQAPGKHDLVLPSASVFGPDVDFDGAINRLMVGGEAKAQQIQQARIGRTPVQQLGIGSQQRATTPEAKQALEDQALLNAGTAEASSHRDGGTGAKPIQTIFPDEHNLQHAAQRAKNFEEELATQGPARIIGQAELGAKALNTAADEIEAGLLGKAEVKPTNSVLGLNDTEAQPAIPAAKGKKEAVKVITAAIDKVSTLPDGTIDNGLKVRLVREINSLPEGLSPKDLVKEIRGLAQKATEEAASMKEEFGKPENQKKRFDRELADATQEVERLSTERDAARASQQPYVEAVTTARQDLKDAQADLDNVKKSSMDALNAAHAELEAANQRHKGYDSSLPLEQRDRLNEDVKQAEANLAQVKEQGKADIAHAKEMVQAAKNADIEAMRAVNESGQIYKDIDRSYAKAVKRQDKAYANSEALAKQQKAATEAEQKAKDAKAKEPAPKEASSPKGETKEKSEAPADSEAAEPAKPKKPSIRMTVDGEVKDIELDEAQVAAYKEAKANYDAEVVSAKAEKNPEERAKRLKAAAYKFSAVKRQITGLLTAKEQKKKDKEAKAVTKGKRVTVTVDGKQVEGTVESKPAFGNVKVLLDGDTEATTHSWQDVEVIIAPEPTKPVAAKKQVTKEEKASAKLDTEASRAAILADPKNIAMLVKRAIEAIGEVTKDDRVLDGNKGASIALDGTSPTTGYAVAIDQKFEQVVPAGTDEAKAIEEYLNREDVQKELAARTNTVLGMWRDPKADNALTLDISEVWDSKEEAEDKGEARTQWGIFDIAKSLRLDPKTGKFQEGFVGLRFREAQEMLFKHLTEQQTKAGNDFVPEQMRVASYVWAMPFANLAKRDGISIEAAIALHWDNGLAGIVGYNEIRLVGKDGKDYSIAADVDGSGRITLNMRSLPPEVLSLLANNVVQDDVNSEATALIRDVVPKLNALVANKVHLPKGRDLSKPDIAAKYTQESTDQFVENTYESVMDFFKHYLPQNNGEFVARAFHWYGPGVEEAMKEMAKFYPELALGKDGKPVDYYAHTMVGTMLGITSAGVSPDQALDATVPMYEDYRAAREQAVKDGKDPDLVPIPLVDVTKFVITNSSFRREDGIKWNIEVALPGGGYGMASYTGAVTINGIAAKKFGGSMSKTLDWLYSKHPVQEIVAASNLTKSTSLDLPDETNPYGAYVLGAKIGAFVANIHGHFDELTPDIWMYREWRGALGTLEIRKGQKDKDGKDTEDTGLPLNETERRAMRIGVDNLAKKLEGTWKSATPEGKMMRSILGKPQKITRANIQATLWYMTQQTWARQGSGSIKSRSFHDAAMEIGAKYKDRIAEREVGRQAVQAAWLSGLYHGNSPERQALEEGEKQFAADPNKGFRPPPKGEDQRQPQKDFGQDANHGFNMVKATKATLDKQEAAQEKGKQQEQPANSEQLGYNYSFPPAKEQYDQNYKVTPASWNQPSISLHDNLATVQFMINSVAEMVARPGITVKSVGDKYAVMLSDGSGTHSVYDTKEEAKEQADLLKSERTEFNQGPVRLKALELQRDFVIQELHKATGMPVTEIEDRMHKGAREHARLLPIRQSLFMAQQQGQTKEQQINSPKFKKWFKDSKVVDKDGRPLVAYHGTSGDFDSFNQTLIKDAGFHFGSKGQANAAAGFSDELGDWNPLQSKSVMPVYLSIQNPLRVKDIFGIGLSFQDNLDTLLETGGFAVTPEQKARLENAVVTSNAIGEGAASVSDVYDKGRVFIEAEKNFWKAVNEVAGELGYDGYVYANNAEGRGDDSYVALDPAQIKSAIGNNGNFDSEDRNILHQPAQTQDNQVLGSTTFMKGTKDPALMGIFKGAGIHTITHEFTHGARRFLNDADMALSAAWVAKVTGHPVIDGQWNRLHEEAFARGFEQYLLEGKLLDGMEPEMARVFEAMKQIFIDIYKGHQNYEKHGRVDDLAGPLDDNIRGVFARLLGLETGPMTPEQDALIATAKEDMARALEPVAVFTTDQQADARDMMLTYTRWDFRLMPIVDQRGLLEEIFEVKNKNIKPKAMEDVLTPVFGGQIHEFRESALPDQGRAALQRRLTKRLHEITDLNPQDYVDSVTILEIERFASHAFNALYPNRSVARRRPSYVRYLAYYQPQMLLSVNRARATLAGINISEPRWRGREERLRNLLANRQARPMHESMPFGPGPNYPGTPRQTLYQTNVPANPEAEAALQKVVDYFGTTDNIKDVGMLHPDGRGLALFKDGWDMHANKLVKAGVDDLSLLDFITETGAARISSDGFYLNVETGAPLTRAQAEYLEDHAYSHRETRVDFHKKVEGQWDSFEHVSVEQDDAGKFLGKLRRAEREAFGHKPEYRVLYSANPPNPALNDAELFEALEEIANEFETTERASFGTILGDVRKSMMLSSPKTHLRNMAGNLAYQGLEEVSRYPAVMFDVLAAMRYGQRSITADPRDLAKAIGFAFSTKDGETTVDQGGLRRFWLELRGVNTGLDSTNHATQTTDRDHGWNIENPVIRKLEQLTQLSFRALAAEDAVFNTFAMRRSLLDMARVAVKNKQVASQAEFMANLDDNTIQRAYADALVATFNSGNIASSAISKLKAEAETRGYSLVKLGLDVIIPFDRTPTNLVLRTLDYTPIGFFTGSGGRSEQSYKVNRRELADGTMTGGESIRTSLHGKFRQAEMLRRIDKTLETAFTKRELELIQREMAKQTGRGLIGSIVMLGAVMGAKGLLKGMFGGWEDDDDEQGRISGMGNSDDNVRNQTTGQQRNAIRIGNRWYSIDGMPPVGNLLLLGASINESMYRGESNLEATGNLLLEAGRQALQLPVVRGFTDLGGALGDENGYKVASFVGRLASSFIPSVVRDIADFKDTKERETGKGLQGVVDRIKLGIPGVRESLPVAKDFLGREAPEKSGAAAFLDIFRSTTSRSSGLDPDSVGKGADADKVLKELSRHDITLTKPVKEEGEAQEDYDKRVTVIGTAIYRTLQAEVQSDRYKEMAGLRDSKGEPMQAEQLKFVMEKAKNRADNHLDRILKQRGKAEPAKPVEYPHQIAAKKAEDAAAKRKAEKAAKKAAQFPTMPTLDSLTKAKKPKPVKPDTLEGLDQPAMPRKANKPWDFEADEGGGWQ